MSRQLVHATGVLCRLLEQAQPTINGAALFGLGVDDGSGGSGKELVHERLLVLGPPLQHVTCPDCEIEMARVQTQSGVDRFSLYCDTCGVVDASRELLQTYSVNLARFIERLSSSLDLSSVHRKVIDIDRSWRLGVQEIKRGRPKTWYFARHLSDHRVARHLLDQIRVDQAVATAVIITSTEVPLPEGSPLAGYEVKHLAAMARLTQSRFVLYVERAGTVATQPEEDAVPGTSLRYVRDQACAYIGGVKYPLEGLHQKILLALIDAHGHRLEGRQLADRCGSQAFPFQPSKYFGRNRAVYKTFVEYRSDDKVYELIIPPEDQDWL